VSEVSGELTVLRVCVASLSANGGRIMTVTRHIFQLKDVIENRRFFCNFLCNKIRPYNRKIGLL
jgi:hypothetical protein